MNNTPSLTPERSVRLPEKFRVNSATFHSICSLGDTLFLSAELDHTVIAIDHSGEVKFTLGGPDQKGTALSYPRGILAVDSSVWICDTLGNRIVVIDQNGHILNTLETTANGARMFDGPSDLCRYHGRIAVANQHRNNIMLLDSSGDLQAIIEGNRKAIDPTYSIDQRTMPSIAAFPGYRENHHFFWSAISQITSVDDVLITTDLNGLSGYGSFGQLLFSFAAHGWISYKGLAVVEDYIVCLDELTGHLISFNAEGAAVEIPSFTGCAAVHNDGSSIWLLRGDELVACPVQAFSDFLRDETVAAPHISLSRQHSADPTTLEQFVDSYETTSLFKNIRALQKQDRLTTKLGRKCTKSAEESLQSLITVLENGFADTTEIIRFPANIPNTVARPFASLNPFDCYFASREFKQYVESIHLHLSGLSRACGLLLYAGINPDEVSADGIFISLENAIALSEQLLEAAIETAQPLTLNENDSDSTERKRLHYRCILSFSLALTVLQQLTNTTQFLSNVTATELPSYIEKFRCFTRRAYWQDFALDAPSPSSGDLARALCDFHVIQSSLADTAKQDESGYQQFISRTWSLAGKALEISKQRGVYLPFNELDNLPMAINALLHSGYTDLSSELKGLTESKSDSTQPEKLVSEFTAETISDCDDRECVSAAIAHLGGNLNGLRTVISVLLSAERLNSLQTLLEALLARRKPDNGYSEAALNQYLELKHALQYCQRKRKGELIGEILLLEKLAAATKLFDSPIWLLLAQAECQPGAESSFFNLLLKFQQGRTEAVEELHDYCNTYILSPPRLLASTQHTHNPLHAKDALLQLLAMPKNDFNALKTQVQGINELGQLHQAIPYIARAKHLFEDDPLFLTWFANMKFMNGDAPGSLVTLDEHDQRFGESLNSCNLRRLIYIQTAHKSAESFDQHMRTLFPTKETHTVHDLRAAFLSGDVDTLEKRIATLPPQNPAHFNAHLFRALLIIRMFDYQGALPSLDAALALQPGSLVVLTWKAVILTMLHRWDSLDEHIGKMYSAGIISPLFAGIFGMRAARLGKLDTALHYLRTAIVNGQNNTGFTSLFALEYGVLLQAGLGQERDVAFLRETRLPEQYQDYIRALYAWLKAATSAEEAAEPLTAHDTPAVPSHDFLNATRGALLSSCGRHAEAVSLIATVIRRIPHPLLAEHFVRSQEAIGDKVDETMKRNVADLLEKWRPGT